MTKIVIYTKDTCPYCVFAKQLLDSKKATYEEIRIDLLPEKRQEMEQLSGRRTVPQIVINGQAVGGYTDLAELAKTGKLDELLA
jgi:glutaredoxin 3